MDALVNGRAERAAEDACGAKPEVREVEARRTASSRHDVGIELEYMYSVVKVRQQPQGALAGGWRSGSSR